ncbi:MAG: competence protein ComEA [Polaribacter sp.]|jgi:competence protein ComEA
MKTFKTLAALVALVFSSLSFASPVNINTASIDEISAALNGVGASKAAAIVEYRTVNGKFSSPDQIVQVSGIGSAIYEKNKADILVK